MNIKHYIAIATAIVALTVTALAQDKLGNFGKQNIKPRRNVAPGKSSQITSPRDAASGQATGKQKAPLSTNAILEFQIPEKIKVENDETHRNRTETVNNNEAIKKQQARNSTNYNLGDTATHEVGHIKKQPLNKGANSRTQYNPKKPGVGKVKR